MVKRKKIIRIVLISGGSLLLAALIAGNIWQFVRYNDLKENNLTTEQHIAK